MQARYTVPIILARTMSTVGIVEAQNIPYIVFVPVAALVFFVSSLAETGRSPFDLLEAESEIVAGFHTEYTGMYFGLFWVVLFLFLYNKECFSNFDWYQLYELCIL